MLKKLVFVVALIALAGAAGLWMAARSSREPLVLGLVDGRLRPCPESPNCVSSDGATGDALVEPLAKGETAPAAFEVMQAILRDRPECEVVKADADYLHATARVGFFGFLDDVELHLDRKAGVLHVRSASRVGHSDMGVNASRVAELRVVLGERLARTGS